MAVARQSDMATSAQAEDIVIYYNDSTDSDNAAAAVALMLAMKKRPSTSVLWILEPRQVSLGLAMTKKQTTRCQELIGRYFPAFQNPFKVLLGGLLNMGDLDSIHELNADDRELLKMAVKPDYGPKKDAILHARLAAWDLASCLAQWSDSHGSIEIFVDVDSLDEMDNPVNLNFHSHEELFARSEDELKEHETIMSQPLEQRVESLRCWYEECTKRAQGRKEIQGSSVQPLDLDSLCDAIQAAKAVRLFGGSSLRLPRLLIEKDVAGKVQCHLQVGSCDLSANLFSNQFNIALNQKAAAFTFQHFEKFSSFILVPSHSAQNIKYSVLGFTQRDKGVGILERMILGFNFHEDPPQIERKQVTLRTKHANEVRSMPDLTALLCALQPGYMGSSLGFVKVNNLNGVLLFEPASSGLQVHHLGEAKSLTEPDVAAVLCLLAGGSG